MYDYFFMKKGIKSSSLLKLTAVVFVGIVEAVIVSVARELDVDASAVLAAELVVVALICTQKLHILHSFQLKLLINNYTICNPSNI